MTERDDKPGGRTPQLVKPDREQRQAARREAIRAMLRAAEGPLDAIFLAKYVGASEGVVRRDLAELERAGEIAWEKRGAGGRKFFWLVE